MIKGIDHIVVLVHDLDAAIGDYTALGFTVTPGGEHTDGATHNALIAFNDGSYIELIAFKRSAPQHRWWRHVDLGEGLIDFALLPGDTANDIAEARSRGLEINGPVDGGRRRPDGQELRWQTAMPLPEGMPFLCGDVTPRSLRVPEGAAQQHANGVTGVSGVTVAVHNAEATAARYAALLGIETSPTAHIASLGLNIAVFELDRDAIAVVQPTDESGSLGTYLATSGPGIYAISLLTEREPPNDWPAANLAHGTRMELHHVP